jgi:hypothetical protein
MAQVDAEWREALRRGAALRIFVAAKYALKSALDSVGRFNPSALALGERVRDRE